MPLPGSHWRTREYRPAFRAWGQPDRARLVGEATAGSTGQPLAIEGLPAGGGARICTKRDTFPDGTEFVGVGVLPDVEIRPTIADLVGGRDTVLERGLAELRARIGK